MDELFVKLLLYVDDQIIFAPSVYGLKEMISEIGGLNSKRSGNSIESDIEIEVESATVIKTEKERPTFKPVPVSVAKAVSGTKAENHEKSSAWEFIHQNLERRVKCVFEACILRVVVSLGQKIRDYVFVYPPLSPRRPPRPADPRPVAPTMSDETGAL
ncbi:hypothetical protein EVAR_30540_1 [Eumeta japonica]|uniref:Uncharacterized protein n=1 Tax=Eumeta variegata TaxID=151549 RepID=A0A4C1VPZ6_EUMVA|nr:hypothetical protein EVAR_30540_1 [Eumeta japonica]